MRMYDSSYRRLNKTPNTPKLIKENDNDNNQCLVISYLYDYDRNHLCMKRIQKV